MKQKLYYQFKAILIRSMKCMACLSKFLIFKLKKNEKKRAVETANPSSMGKYFKKGGIMFGNVAIEDFSRHQGNSNDR